MTKPKVYLARPGDLLADEELMAEFVSALAGEAERLAKHYAPLHPGTGTGQAVHGRRKGAPGASRRRGVDRLRVDPRNPEPGIARVQMWDEATGTLARLEDVEIELDYSGLQAYREREGDIGAAHILTEDEVKEVVLDALGRFDPRLRCPKVVVSEEAPDLGGNYDGTGVKVGGGAIRIHPSLLYVYSALPGETNSSKIERVKREVLGTILHENGHHIDSLMESAVGTLTSPTTGPHSRWTQYRQEMHEAWVARYEEQYRASNDSRMLYQRAWNNWVDFDVSDLIRPNPRGASKELIADSMRYAFDDDPDFDLPGSEMVWAAMEAAEFITLDGEQVIPIGQTGSAMS